MKSITLINSPLFEDKHDLNNEDYLPPLGLGVIATELRKHNDVQVRLIDAIAENKNVSEIVATISDSQPDFVGINIFTTNFKHVKKIVEQTKTKTAFIIGGISTKSLYKEIFKWNTENSIDIVYGDGELITNDIVHDCVKEKPVERNDTFRYFAASKDSTYYVRDISNEVIDRTLFRNEPYANCYGRPEASIYTSRGCVHNCAYCVAASGINRQLGVRTKDIPGVIAELNRVKSLYPTVEYVRVLDDLFLRSPQSFADANTIFMQFDLSWRAMCHIKPLLEVDIKTLCTLRANGCTELFVGIESGSRRILKKIHKGTDSKMILKATNKVFQAGINLKGYFICGFPSETLQDLDDTLYLAEKIRQQANKHHVAFRTSTFQFRPYHGTELYDDILSTFPELKADSVLFDIKESEGVRSRKPFHFDSGNYSSVSDSDLQNYIGRMNALNGTV